MRRFYLLLSFFLWSGSTFAYQADQGNFGMLPPWCKAKYAEMYESGKVEGITIRPERYKIDLWKRRVGSPWVHFHHYCPALIHILSAKYGSYRQYGKSKKEVLDKAVSNIDYTTSHSDLNNRTAWIFADAKMWLGKIAELEKNTGTAVQLYNESIATYKKYIPAYIALSDLYEDQGNYRKAIDWIDNALKLKPRSRLLKSKKKRLKEKLK